MAYAILRTTKHKTIGTAAASLQHAYRERETKNADPEKSKDNVVIKQLDEEAFKNRIEEYRTRPERGTAQDNVVCIEILLTTSPEYWEGKTQADLDKWVDKNTKFLENKFGADNIHSLVLHMDETTPHLSGHAIPVVNERLNCKHYLGGKAKMSGLQTEYAKQMHEFGLERGQRGSIAEHQTVQEFYAELEKTKVQVLERNPDITVEVKPEQLREPGFSDRANIKAYKAEVIIDTVSIMQKEINALTDQNRQLTARLANAERTIKRQTDELTRHRAETAKNRDELDEYRELKNTVLTQPGVIKTIEEVKKPHLGAVRGYRAQNIPEVDIAYKLLKEHGATTEQTREVMKRDGGFGYRIDKDVDEASKRVEVDTAKERAEAEAANRAFEGLKDYEKKYISYKQQGKTDVEAATLLIQKDGFDKKSVVTAIKEHSKNAPAMSDKARIYAAKIVKDIPDMRGNSKAVSKSKPTGGGMAIGGGSSASRDMNHNKTGLPLPDLAKSNAVALDTRVKDHDDRPDWDMLTVEQRETKAAEIKAESSD